MKKPFNGRVKLAENEDGYYAICNAVGNPISDYYYEIEFYTPLLSRVYDDDKQKYALILETGSLVSKWYDDIELLNNGLSKVYDEETDKYALLSESGTLISSWFEYIDDFKNDRAEVTNENDEYALIDRNGQVVTQWVEYSNELYSNKDQKTSNSNDLPVNTNEANVSPKQAPTTSIAGYKVKIFESLEIQKNSTNPDDYIEILNTISPAMGGVTNLGVFSDIKNIEHTSALLAEVEEQFIHVETERDEQPYDNLVNDNSSSNPYDFDFNHLLNH